MTLTTKVPAKTRNKIKKLARITQELYQGKDFNITRLTSLKSLCEQHDIAKQFVYHLAICTEKNMGEKTPKYLKLDKWKQHKELAKKALLQMDEYLESDSEDEKKSLRTILDQLKNLQNQYERQHWGPVRLIECSESLLIETAIRCILSSEESGFWAYHVGRTYAERFNSNCCGSLTPESAPLMEDIINFWVQYYKLEGIKILKDA